MSVEIPRTPIVRAAPPVPLCHSGLSDPVAVHYYAIRLMAVVEQEIGDLWRDTIDSGDPHLSDSLVELEPRGATGCARLREQAGHRPGSCREQPTSSL